MVLYAYVGWLEQGEPRVYYTRDPDEAEQGLLRVSVTHYARTKLAREVARQRARRQLLTKWEQYYGHC